jgi:hypothetical protein
MNLEKAVNHGDTADTAKSGEKQKICFCFSPGSKYRRG